VAVSTLRFANGTIGKVMCLVGGVTPFTFHFALYGTQGTIRNNQIWINNFPRFDEPGMEEECLELPKSWIPDNVQGGVSETWGLLDDHFVDMLVRDVPSLNDVESAYRTSQACFAALESARTGKTVSLE
jgi:predicted dehydrogenase